MATYPAIFNPSNATVIRIVMESAALQMQKKLHGGAVKADVLLMLSPELKETVKTYNAIVVASVKAHAQSIQVFVAEHGALPRKKTANLVMKQFDPRLHSIIFATLDGEEPLPLLSTLLMNASNSDAGTKTYCDLFGLSWDKTAPAAVH